MNPVFISLAATIAVVGTAAVGGSVALVMALWKRPKLVSTVRPYYPRQRPPAYRQQLAAGLSRVKCTWCSGGTQWHNPATATWGPIPEHLLYRVRADDGDFDCRPPLHTGLRTCNNCAGFGGIYQDTPPASSYQDQ